MQDSEKQRPLTPPHHPTAGVDITLEEIATISAYSFPQSELVSVTQLPSGQSFNNRIYFLKLRYPIGNRTETLEQEVVLKVNGRFFGRNKIQNEVACLHLLDRYCPSAPTPRALAWSEDGSVAIVSTPFASGSYSLLPPPGLQKSPHGGWILMTKLAGDVFDGSAMDIATVMDLGVQLGNIVASWRQDIPAQLHCGNVCLPASISQQGDYSVANFTFMKIRGILQEGIHVEEPVGSTNEYYRLKLTDKLLQLESVAVFAPNRSLAQPIRTFISEKLPHIDFEASKGSGKYIFTHYDLSPRNVLIAGHPPRITGIVDFEFAGFFPNTEEFLNDYINNNGDWPPEFYQAYLDRLEANRIATPKRSIDQKIWHQNIWLETLVSCIAPWYLPGSSKGPELQSQLKKVESSARQMLERLNNPERHYKEPIKYGE